MSSLRAAARHRSDEATEPLRLLLRAALARDPDEAVQAWSGWRQRAPAAGSDPRARRLLPLIHCHLGARADDPEGLLRGAYERTRAANVRLLEAAASAARLLAAADIPALALKGAALAVLHYRDPGARPMGDVDLAVPGERAVEAVRLLQANGWVGPGVDRGRQRGQHATALKDASGRCLDLHWHVSYEARFAEADAGFWHRAVPCAIAGAPVLALDPSDQLLLSVVHGVRWSSVPSLVWIADAVTIARGGDVDPEQLADLARRLRLSWPLRRGLELA